jgi:hypothetical protein
MSKILLTIAVAFLFNSSMAKAEVKTFNFIFSGTPNSNNANASGFITLDTDFITNSSSTFPLESRINISQIIDLGLTVTGASTGNGNFTKSNFGHVTFNSTSGLDFSRELVGQSLTNGGVFGTSFNGFNLWVANGSAPSANGWSQLRSNGGTGDRMNLASLTAVNPVPEADTSAMLLMGAGVMGFIARRRKQVSA